MRGDYITLRDLCGYIFCTKPHIQDVYMTYRASPYIYPVLKPDKYQHVFCFPVFVIALPFCDGPWFSSFPSTFQ